MKYLGDWKVHSVMTFGQDGVVYKSADEIRAECDDPSELQVFFSTIRFCEDGMVRTLFPIPDEITQEQIDEAIEAGEEIVDDRFAVIEKKEWKEENGDILVDSGTQGEILGEAVSPWVALKEDENGLLQFMVMKLERA